MRITILHPPLALNHVVKASIIIVFVIGLLTCVEWIADLFFLNAASSFHPSMRLITAELLVLSSLSLWLFLSQRSWRKHFLRITGGIIVFVSFLTILSYLQGDAAHQTDYMLFVFFLKTDNRMAFFTSVIFGLLGLIFILIASNSRTRGDIAHVLIFPALSMSYFAIISYMLGVSDLFQIEGLTIASSTAFCLFLLSIVVLFLKPDTWLMRTLLGTGPGSIMGRRLLPWLLVLPVVIAWLRIKLEPQGLLPTGISAILIAVTYSISFILLVWWSGLHVNRVDEKRRQAHDALGESEARLNALITATSDGVFSMSPDWKQILRMEGGNFLRTVERPLDDWLNQFIPRDTQPLMLEAINRAIATRSKFELEHKVIRQDGSIGWTLSRAIPVLDQSGEIVEWMGIAHDFTERKHTELALQNSEKNLSDIYNSMTEGISVNQLIYDEEGNAVDYVLVYANPAFEEITGQKLSEFKGKRGSERYSMQKAPYLDTWAKVVASGEPTQFETYFAPLKKYFSISGFSMEEGKFATLFWDITAIKLAEKALLESTEQFRLLFENSLDAIVYTNSEGTVLSMNPEAERILGRSKEEMLHLSKDFIDLNDPRYIAALQERQKTGRFKGELNFLKKDGTPFPVDLTSTTFTDSSGQEKSGYIFRDITKRKRNEEVLAFQAQLLSEVNDAVFSSDSHFRLTYWNQTAEKMFGWTKEEALGHNSAELLKPTTDVSTIDEARSNLKNEGYWIGEGQFMRKDGTYFYTEVNSKILKDAEGNYAGQIVVARDITERKRAQAEIIAAKEKAEESDRLKSAFVANMSHELRTPLNSIIGFSELMMDPNFDPDQKAKYSQIVHASGNNLLSIINDIMDISKIEAGQVQITNQLFSVNNLITELREEYSLKASQKGIEIILDPLNPAEDVFMESDQTKIRQVLVNLLGNAIKFTEKGFVQLGWKITGNFIEFQVKDTGIGIPAEFQAQIFERFRQVESAETRKYGGTGLGLAISKSLTELLGGTIRMESKSGEGSTFYFTVPFRPSQLR